MARGLLWLQLHSLLAATRVLPVWTGAVSVVDECHAQQPAQQVNSALSLVLIIQHGALTHLRVVATFLTAYAVQGRVRTKTTKRASRVLIEK